MATNHPAWLRDKAESIVMQQIRGDIRTILYVLSADALHALEDPDAVTNDIVRELVTAEVNRRISA